MMMMIIIIIIINIPFSLLSLYCQLKTGVGFREIFQSGKGFHKQQSMKSTVIEVWKMYGPLLLDPYLSREPCLMFKMSHSFQAIGGNAGASNGDL